MVNLNKKAIFCLILIIILLVYFWFITGNLRQPKYGHLKELHSVLKSMEKTLVHGEYFDTNYGDNITVIFRSRPSFNQNYHV